MTINLVTENNINLLSYSFVSQKYDLGFVRIKSRFWQGHFLFEGSRGRIHFLAFSNL